MRKFFIAVTVMSALGFAAEPAFAADGCSYDSYGQLYCQPGAQPGVPYGYGSDPYGRSNRYREYDRPDPGAAVALGILGAAAGAIADDARRDHHHRYRD